MSLKSLTSKHTVTVQVENQQRTARGSVDRQPFTTVARGVPCWVQAVEAVNVFRYQKQNMETTHLVWFSADAGLTQQHSLLFETRRLYVLAYKDLLELGRVWVAECKEKSQGEEP